MSQYLEKVYHRYTDHCRSVVAYKTTIMPIHTMTSIIEGGKLSLYDSVDEEVLRCYREFSLANLIFYAMKESACSEQSQRMTAMDAATKNAGLYIFGDFLLCSVYYTEGLMFYVCYLFHYFWL